MKGCEDVGPWAGRPLAQTLMKSDEVEAMLHLHALGWGLKRIAREFGCSKNTVRRYVEADGWMTYNRRAGGGKLEGPGGVAEGALLPTPRPPASGGSPSASRTDRPARSGGSLRPAGHPGSTRARACRAPAPPRPLRAAQPARTRRTTARTNATGTR